MLLLKAVPLSPNLCFIVSVRSSTDHLVEASLVPVAILGTNLRERLRSSITTSKPTINPFLSL